MQRLQSVSHLITFGPLEIAAVGPKDKRVLIEEKKLRRFVTDIFRAARSSAEEPTFVAGHLVEAISPVTTATV
jgi:hypothetical protein